MARPHEHTGPLRAGAGTMGAQIAAIWRTAGYSVHYSSLRARRAGGLDARASQTRHVLTPDAAARIRTGGFDSNSMDRAGRWQRSGHEQADAKRSIPSGHSSARRLHRQLRTHKACRNCGLAKGAATISAGTGSARIFSISRDICRCSKSFLVRHRAGRHACAHFTDRARKNACREDTPGSSTTTSHAGIVRIFEALASGTTRWRKRCVTVPRSEARARVRTVDIAGLEFGHVADDLRRSCPCRGSQFRFPASCMRASARGSRESGRGFYEPGQTTRADRHLALDPQKMEYAEAAVKCPRWMAPPRFDA